MKAMVLFDAGNVLYDGKRWSIEYITNKNRYNFKEFTTREAAREFRRKYGVKAFLSVDAFDSLVNELDIWAN